MQNHHTKWRDPNSLCCKVIYQKLKWTDVWMDAKLTTIPFVQIWLRGKRTSPSEILWQWVGCIIFMKIRSAVWKLSSGNQNVRQERQNQYICTYCKRKTQLQRFLTQGWKKSNFFESKKIRFFRFNRIFMIFITLSSSYHNNKLVDMYIHCTCTCILYFWNKDTKIQHQGKKSYWYILKYCVIINDYNYCEWQKIKYENSHLIKQGPVLHCIIQNTADCIVILTHKLLIINTHFVKKLHWFPVEEIIEFQMVFFTYKAYCSNYAPLLCT